MLRKLIIFTLLFSVAFIANAKQLKALSCPLKSPNFCSCLKNQYVTTCKKAGHSGFSCSPFIIFTYIKFMGKVKSCHKGCLQNPAPTYKKCMAICEGEYNAFYNAYKCDY